MQHGQYGPERNKEQDIAIHIQKHSPLPECLTIVQEPADREDHGDRAYSEQVLQRVRDAGLRIAVVTGSGQGTLLQRLETNYRGFFRPELIVSSRDCERGKPNPDPYLLGLQRVGVSADAALVVENAPLGVMAAHAAGIFTIAVNTGPLPDSDLAAEGADRIFPDMYALLEWLKSLA